MVFLERWRRQFTTHVVLDFRLSFAYPSDESVPVRRTGGRTGPKAREFSEATTCNP